MCRRFALYSDPFTLAQHFKADVPPELRPRYNIAPSQDIPMVRMDGEKRRIADLLGLDPAVGKGYENRL
ncbi:MAG: SOS response-associated peptidase family protein [Methylobacter sp.]